MGVLAKSIYHLDLKNKKIENKAIPEEITDFIRELLKYIALNKSVKKYKPTSQNTQVVSCVCSIMNIIINNEKDEKLAEKDLDALFKEVAERWLDSELKAQKRIEHMDVNVKKGSLLQAAVYLEDSNQFTYLIAKVNHEDFIEDINYTAKSGFAKRESVWKSCQFSFTNDCGTVIIDNAHVYVDQTVKYWPEDFLELKESTPDEINTQTSFSFCDSVLSRNIKKEHPSDYWSLRNDVLGYFRLNPVVDFDIMVESVFRGHTNVTITDELLEKTKSKLLTNPETRKFDSRFNSVPASLKARQIHKSFPVNNGIEINLFGNIDNFNNVIKSGEEAGGERYIQITVSNSDTYNAFKRPDLS